MRKSFNLNVYGDDALKEKFERVKAYHRDKNPGIPLSDSAIGAILIDEAYHKILGAQTNADRITKVVALQTEGIERQDKLAEGQDKLAERQDKVELALGKILNLLERREGDL